MAEAWRRLNFEQRVAAVGAVLLIVSTFGPFSFVELAVVLTGGAVLALLKQRADRKRFHLPFGDGTVIFAAGAWAALLIVVRLFDRPLGQSVLALGCAAILAGAGARERAKRPPDDVPPPEDPTVRMEGPSPQAPPAQGQPGRDEDETVRLPPEEEPPPQPQQ
jgi:hypothetical protein